jgi:transaldolase
MTPLESLIATGTKLWLDSIDPDLVIENRRFGATGATSNPIIVADLIKTGRFDGKLAELMQQGLDDHAVAWAVTDHLVREAQQVFLPVHEETAGNDGYVSFELDPLLEDASCPLSTVQRAEQYIALGKKWSAGHRNRMIKIPATPAGLASLTELAAAGVPLNVTLIFSERQYHAAREAVLAGARRLPNLLKFKSVYSIFVSRIDVYTKQHVPQLSPAAQGQVGLVTTKFSGATSTSPSSRRLSSPAPGPKTPPTRPTNTSPPSPVPTSRPTPREPTRRCRSWPGGGTPRQSPNCPPRQCWPRSTPTSISPGWNRC